jgi:hypothetical protein
MQGGARARSGPPPDPNALRRDRDKVDWIHLPAAGRAEPSPVWPLSRATARELAIWTSEWTRPQAVMWEELGLVAEVALYVRSMKDAEKTKASVAARTLVRQQMDSLGLTVSGLARNRWVIDSAHPVRETTPSDEPDRQSAKARLTSIQGGAA